jgi:hypothetical protein
MTRKRIGAESTTPAGLVRCPSPKTTREAAPLAPCVSRSRPDRRR